MKKIKFLLALSLCFQHALFSQTPEMIKSWLPEIPGWEISEKTEIFDADNLFDRINGAAPLYIENNFKEMTSLEYLRGDDYITIQAYRHASPEDAFGMYASERSSDLSFFPIGGEAQGDAGNMFFFAGNMYVKMWSNVPDDLSQTLQLIASELATKIDPETSYPAVVLAFPKEGSIPLSTTYITSNYIGHEFLNKVYTNLYDSDGKVFQVFVIKADTNDEAKDVISKYLTFTKQKTAVQEGHILINDRYNGEIPILWQGNLIMGIFSENGDIMPNATVFLEELYNNLK